MSKDATDKALWKGSHEDLTQSLTEQPLLSTDHGLVSGKYKETEENSNLKATLC